MKLGWRDGVGTVLAAGIASFTLAVTSGWDWPLLGSPRSATLVMFALGYAGCMVAIGGTKMTAAGDLVRGPFMIAASVLGAAALVVAVVSLIAGTEAMVVALGVVLLLQWLVTTARHSIQGASLPAHPAARL